ncbi:MAG: putative metalloprotease CJM1_0395 family protein [Aquificota bacterium]|nr:putative metalloprotease CJM1_0395 family protein [Aquificota bacterium]
MRVWDRTVYESVRVAIEVQKLRMREQEVKAHEMAHKAVAGDLAGPVKYEYTRGPDGKLYITGGEVPLKVKEGRTPEETVQIARRLKRAALAPANPSPQDIRVAVQATIMEMKATLEMIRGKYLDLRV